MVFLQVCNLNKNAIWSLRQIEIDILLKIDCLIELNWYKDFNNFPSEMQLLEYLWKAHQDMGFFFNIFV